MIVPAINLKAIILVHWLLTVWGCMSFLPSSFAWGNFSMLAVGVWAIAQRDSVDAVLLLLVGMGLTMLTDIIYFCVYYSMAGDPLVGRDIFRFSASMAIFSLLLKPVSCFFIYQMYRERGGDYNLNFGFPSASHNRDSYSSIDQQGQAADPGQGGSTQPAHSY